MQFSSLGSSKMEISETDFFDILTIQDDQISYVKHVLAPLYVFFTLFGCWGALCFGLTFPIPKRALRAHGLPPWGSSAPAHLTHPTAMQPAGGAHASSSSVVRLVPSVAELAVRSCGGAGAGGREVHLCGAPSGLPLPWFCEWKHLQMCSGGQEGRGHGDTVLAIQHTLLHW